jgi:hypothetical protein
LNTNIINATEPIVKFIRRTIKFVRTFDRKGTWIIEAVFEDGIKATRPATQSEVTTLESNLKDMGWQVDPSLFCGGFNAKPSTIGVGVEGLGWPDDYAIPAVTL